MRSYEQKCAQAQVEREANRKKQTIHILTGGKAAAMWTPCKMLNFCKLLEGKDCTGFSFSQLPNWSPYLSKQHKVLKLVFPGLQAKF